MIANTGTVNAVGPAESEASVQFTAPTESTNPVDPREPGDVHEDYEESDPENDGNYGMDGNVTGQDGPLSLDYISNISFGARDISYIESELDEFGNLVLNSVTESPFIQVTDERGFGYGWEVTAEANRFTVTSEDGTQTETLPGAIITFANGDTNSVTPDTIEAPELLQSIVLDTAGGADDVAIANSREEENTPIGLGTWVMSWLIETSPEGTPVGENGNITLSVPSADITEGTHTAIIDWTLTDGP